MGHWNYRVVKYEDGELGLHEAYYGITKSKRPSITEDPIVVGSSRTEIIRALRMMIKDVQKKAPLLDYKTRKELP